MAILVGTLSNSADRPIAKARLTIQLTSGIVEASATPDNTLLPVSTEFVITNGALATAQYVRPDGTLDTAGVIDLFPSEQFGIPYSFVVEQVIDKFQYTLQNGTVYTGPVFQHTDNNWYTGQAPLVVGQNQLLTRTTVSNYVRIDDFFAMIPDEVSIEYSLLRKSGLTSTLDDSLYLVLEQLTSNPVYVDRLSGKISIRGLYSPTVFYNQNDVVVSGSVLSVYINASSQAGQTPPNSAGSPDTAFWAKLPNLTVSPSQQTDLSGLVQKSGDTMSGTLALPDPGGSPGSALALRYAEADARFVRLANIAQSIAGVKTFTTSPLIPTATPGDNSLNGANTAFVTAAVLAGAGRLAQPIARVRRNATQTLTIGANTTIVWDNFPTAGFFDTNGAYTVPAGGAGQYLMVLMPLTFQMEGNFSANERRFRLRVYLSINNVDVGDFLFEDVAAVNTTSGGLNAPLQFRRSGHRIESLSVGDVIRVVGNPTAGGVNSFTSCSIATGQANNVFSIWRLAA